MAKTKAPVVVNSTATTTIAPTAMKKTVKAKTSKVSLTKIVNTLLAQKGQIFNVTFTEKNGKVRNLTGRLLKGSDGKTHRPNAAGNLLVKDMFSGTRTVNTGRITALKASGTVYSVK